MLYARVSQANLYLVSCHADHAHREPPRLLPPGEDALNDRTDLPLPAVGGGDVPRQGLVKRLLAMNERLEAIGCHAHLVGFPAIGSVGSYVTGGVGLLLQPGQFSSSWRAASGAVQI